MTPPACHACGRSDGTHEMAEHQAYRESNGVRCHCGRWADWESVFFPRITMSPYGAVLREDVWCIEDVPVIEQGSAGVCKVCRVVPVPPSEPPPRAVLQPARRAWWWPR
jgi:hypothetical protein